MSYDSPVSKSFYHTNYGWVNASGGNGSLSNTEVTNIVNILGDYTENITINTNGSTGTSSISFKTDYVDFNARYIFLNRGNLDENSDGGLVVNVSKNPFVNTMTVVEPAFSPANDTENAMVTVDDASGILPNQFISVYDSAHNNGIYEVMSVIDNTIIILGVGSDDTVQPFSKGNFIEEIAGTAKINLITVTVMRGTKDDEFMEIAKGATNNLIYHKVTTDDQTQELTN